MPLILLIRHGENDYVKKHRLAGRLPEVHLNKTGRVQAQALAERLGDAPVAAIYSSPLERALETATPLALTLGKEVIQRPRLIESDMGEWQGCRVKEVSRLKIWRVVQSRPSLFRFPGGESFAEIQQRMCQELDELAARHEPKEIIACISHADPIKLALAYYLGLPLDLFQRLSAAPASVSALFLGEGASQLISMNLDFSLSFLKP